MRCLRSQITNLIAGKRSGLCVCCGFVKPWCYVRHAWIRAEHNGPWPVSQVGDTLGWRNTLVMCPLCSLSRYKLKFSPDKVDTMIVQAICRSLEPRSLLWPWLDSSPPLPALLDDLDKELNNYSMRLREWYGWHFPELGKIVVDNLLYARTVKTIGEFGTERGKGTGYRLGRSGSEFGTGREKGTGNRLGRSGSEFGTGREKGGQAIDWGGVVLKWLIKCVGG